MLKLVLGGKDRSLAGHDLLFQLQKLLRPFLIWRGFFVYESHTSIFLSSGIGLFQYPASRQPAASFAGGRFFRCPEVSELPAPDWSDFLCCAARSGALQRSMVVLSFYGRDIHLLEFCCSASFNLRSRSMAD